MGTALVVCVYAICLYYRRLHLMINAKPYGYGDTIGPLIFVLIVIVGIALTIHYINYTFLPPNPRLEVEQGVCVQRNLGSGHLMI